MTEPTEADFAAYDAALERMKVAFRGHANTDTTLCIIRDFYRREFAQAIAEARAQGRREAIEECAVLCDQNYECFLPLSIIPRCYPTVNGTAYASAIRALADLPASDANL